MTAFARAPQAAIAAVTALILAGPAAAQDRSPNFFDNLFGNNNAQAQTAGRGADDADLTVQINQLQQQVRQLTGTIEQLQYRNQQLEQQLRALQGNAGGAPVPGPTASTGTAYPANPPSRGMQQQPMQQDYPQRGMQQPQQDYPQRGMQPPPQDYPSRGVQQSPQDYPSRGVQQDYPQRGMQQTQQDYQPPAVIAATPGSGRDVFDPSQHPNTPGAPRPLGSPDSASQPIGAPQGRNAGAPLDLSVPGSRPVADDPGMLPPPPPRNPNATGTQVASVTPPTATPRDEFDLAYGYVQRKDYALAEDSLRAFLKKYPSDGRAADAQYWLGESLYQRQRYRDAAESFLAVSTKFDRNPKAPESLLRLGQSLAALGEKETACAAWGEIGRKYANASVTVKKNVAAEQKRVRC